MLHMGKLGVLGWPPIADFAPLRGGLRRMETKTVQALKTEAVAFDPG